MENIVQSTLLELGVTPNLKGFAFICDAVEIVRAEGNVKVMHIYDKIARDNNTTQSRVEKSIRHAISHADEEAWISIGGTGRRNSEFIHTLELLTREERK